MTAGDWIALGGAALAAFVAILGSLVKVGRLQQRVDRLESDYVAIAAMRDDISEFKAEFAAMRQDVQNQGLALARLADDVRTLIKFKMEGS